jgi:hypothetical protein
LALKLRHSNIILLVARPVSGLIRMLRAHNFTSRRTGRLYLHLKVLIRGCAGQPTQPTQSTSHPYSQASQESASGCNTAAAVNVAQGVPCVVLQSLRGVMKTGRNSHNTRKSTKPYVTRPLPRPSSRSIRGAVRNLNETCPHGVQESSSRQLLDDWHYQQGASSFRPKRQTYIILVMEGCINQPGEICRRTYPYFVPSPSPPPRSDVFHGHPMQRTHAPMLQCTI